MSDTVTVYPKLEGMADILLTRWQKEKVRRKLYQREYRKRKAAEKKHP